MLSNKVIVITGASSGIGAEMAKLFSEKNAKIVLLGRSLDRLGEVRATIKRASAEAIQLDVTDVEQVNRVMSSIIEQYGRIDVLINNAGFAVFESFERSTLEQFEAMMDVNYMGIVRCTKAVLPSMLEQKQGHIINIASLAGKIGSAKSTGYSASKHAVLGLTNSLRQELHGTGIIVSAVNPGPIDTPFFKLSDPSGSYLKSMPNWFILKPGLVAKEVLKVIIKRKSEINIPRIANTGVKLIQLFPSLINRLAGRVLNRK